MSLDDMLDSLPSRSTWAGRVWTREGIWQAQEAYASDGYAAELVGNIVDFAVGARPIVDWGNEARNEDWQAWRWNPLSPGDDPVQLARQMGISLVRDGDIFFERVGNLNEEGSPPMLLQLDPRHIWSYAGSGANEVQGVRLSQTMRPEAYLYRPIAVLPWEAVPRQQRDIPAEMMIHRYRTEYAGQPRGDSWIRRAVPYLRLLQQIDGLLYRAMDRMVRSPGYWQYPVEYMIQDASEESLDPDDPDEARIIREIYRRVLLETRWEDVDIEPRLPQGINWQPKPLSGVTAPAIQPLRRALIERIARSTGISALSLSADSEGLNFLAARVTSRGDQNFYRTLQALLRGAISEAAGYYRTWATAQGREHWMDAPRQPRIDLPAMPYDDPLKDAAAIQIQIRSGILSPQQAIRDAGRDPETTMGEIEEWRERMGTDTAAEDIASADILGIGE